MLEPGTKYGDSSYGYNLPGAVGEGVSGMPFVEFVEANMPDVIGTTGGRGPEERRWLDGERENAAGS